MSQTVDSNTVKMWIVAGGLVFVLGVVLLFLQWQVPGKITYDASDQALYCVHDDQCERPGSEKLIAEVQNTLSNLAYLLFGVCVLVRAGREGVPMRRRPGMVLFGVTLCFLAICSGYYHATLNFAGTDDGHGGLRAVLNEFHKLVCLNDPDRSEMPQLLDMIGVYAVLMALLLYGIEGLVTKDFGGVPVGSVVWAVVLGLVIPVIALAAFAQAEGVKASLALAIMLGVLAMLTLARQALARGPDAEGVRRWVGWVLWAVVLALALAFSYAFKAQFRWDSTMVFAAMMGLMAGVLGVNWSLSRNPIPGPEFVILAIVFLLGIAPRVMDGYHLADEDTRVARKVFCSPDGLLSAHACWHVLSAVALALCYDLVEKSRAVYDGAGGTLLLPQSGELSDALRDPATVDPAALVIKIVLSAASLLLLIVYVANYEGFALLLLSALPCVLSALLWYWRPLGAFANWRNVR